MKNPFDQLGKSPETENLTILTLDIPAGVSEDFLFLGISADDVILDPQYGPTKALQFQDRVGIVFHEAGTVLVGLYEDGKIESNNFYRITSLGEKVSKAGRPYKQYHVARLTPGQPEELDETEKAV